MRAWLAPFSDSPVQLEYAKVVYINPSRCNTTLGSKEHMKRMVMFMSRLSREEYPCLVVMREGQDRRKNAFLAIPVSLDAFSENKDELNAVKVPEELAGMIERGVLSPPEICVVLD